MPDRQKTKNNTELAPEALDAVRSKIKAAAYSLGGRNLDTLFAQLDKDHSSTLDFEELSRALRKTFKISPNAIADDEIKGVWLFLDEDGSGSISVQEFKDFVGTEPVSESTYKIKAPPKKEKPPLSPETLDSVRLKIRAAAYSVGGRNLDGLFARIDRDNSGELEHAEFIRAIRKDFKIPVTLIPDDDISGLCAILDTDGNGMISIDEFKEFLGPEPEAPPKYKVRAFQKQALSEEAIALARNKIKAATYGSGGRTRKSVDALFARLDKDGSQALDDAEFRRALRKDLKISPETIPEKEVDNFFSYIDADGDGVISLAELRDFIGPEESTSTYEVKAPAPKPRPAPLQGGELEKVRQKLKAAAYANSKGMQLDALFKRLDKDGSGYLDEAELLYALRRHLFIPPSLISDGEVSALCALLDIDGNGKIDVEELISFANPKTDDCPTCRVCGTSFKACFAICRRCGHPRPEEKSDEPQFEGPVRVLPGNDMAPTKAYNEKNYARLHEQHAAILKKRNEMIAAKKKLEDEVAESVRKKYLRRGPRAKEDVENISRRLFEHSAARLERLESERERIEEDTANLSILVTDSEYDEERYAAWSSAYQEKLRSWEEMKKSQEDQQRQQLAERSVHSTVNSDENPNQRLDDAAQRLYSDAEQRWKRRAAQKKRLAEEEGESLSRMSVHQQVTQSPSSQRTRRAVAHRLGVEDVKDRQAKLEKRRARFAPPRLVVKGDPSESVQRLGVEDVRARQERLQDRWDRFQHEYEMSLEWQSSKTSSLLSRSYSSYY